MLTMKQFFQLIQQADLAKDSFRSVLKQDVAKPSKAKNSKRDKL